jgi:hypothetical protein
VIGGVYTVEYKRSLTLLGPRFAGRLLATFKTALLQKAMDWRYEDEYRVLARDVKDDPAFETTSDSEFVALSTGAITGVIAGWQADTQSIESLVCEYRPRLPFKKIKRSVDRYSLNVHTRS